ILIQRAVLHVVAEIVEAELVVVAVADLRFVGGDLLVVRLLADDDARGQAAPVVELAHRLGVTSRQVVVDRHDVHAAAFEGVQVDRQRGHEGLALTGAHLGDLAFVQDHAAHELDVVVAHAEHASTRLAADGERLHHEVVDGGPVVEPLLELGRLGLQLGVAELLERRFEGVDLLDPRLHAGDGAFVRRAEELFGNPGEHWRKIEPVSYPGSSSPGSGPRREPSVSPTPRPARERWNRHKMRPRPISSRLKWPTRWGGGPRGRGGSDRARGPRGRSAGHQGVGAWRESRWFCRARPSSKRRKSSSVTGATAGTSVGRRSSTRGTKTRNAEL